MITNKHINKIIMLCIVIALVCSGVMIYWGNTDKFKESSGVSLAYESQLFDHDSIMTVDIQVDEDSWNEMIENASSEEYISCDVVINGVTYSNVGIRPKGNTSLSQIVSDDTTDRFSFKVEFDHYDKNQNCYGLDKLVLNNVMSDSTYMKEYLSYDILNYAGVVSPLYNYASITVNGEDWGFYLALEGMEESFAMRNYGSNYGQLYKPETMGAGGGRNEDDQSDTAISDMKQRKENWNKQQSGQEETTDQNSETTKETTKETTDQNTDTTKETTTDQNTDTSNATTEQNNTQGNATTGQNNNQGMTPPNDQSNGQGMTPPNDQSNGQGMTPPNDQSNEQGMTPPNDQSNGQSESNTTNSTSNEAGNTTEDQQNQASTQQEAGAMPDFSQMQQGMGNMGGGFGSSMSSASLQYIDDNIESYSTIFDAAVFDTDESDYERVITAIKNLNEGTDLETYVDVDAMLRYIAANTVIVNLDSYFSSMQHNYYLYEQDGQITMLPWDYNLSFAGFQSGTATSAVNFPIDTPVSGVTLEDRPIIAKLFENEEYLERYHQILQEIVTGYFDSGLFQSTVAKIDKKISSYVKTDATAFYTFDEYETGVENLTQFGLLRAKSIQGQLDGTIPSTTDGQEEDSTTLIDASNVDLTAMGTQGGGDGEMKQKFDQTTMAQDQMPGMQTESNAESSTEANTQSNPEGKADTSTDSSMEGNVEGKTDNNTQTNTDANIQNNEQNNTQGNQAPGDPSNTDQSQMFGNRQQMGNGPGQDMFIQEQSSQDYTKEIILLSVCGGLLLIAMVVVICFKRRKYHV